MPEQGVKHLPHKEILSYEEILRLIHVAISCGVTKIRITGGEPLTRKGLICFIEQLRLLRGLDDVTLTTNGVLLASCAGELKKAGLPRIRFHDLTHVRPAIPRKSAAALLTAGLAGPSLNLWL